MPRLLPFRGLRYGPSVPLDLVIAPPYDVVDARERTVLAQRHPANSILVELPAPDAASGLGPYANAARLLQTWTEAGIIRQDPSPAFYAYRMTTPSGRRTTGVIGALGLERPGGEILPHEQTIPKDKTDRLELLRACRANLSPIWGLSLASGLSDEYRLDLEPQAQATDDDGVLHQLWVVSEPARLSAITERVASSPVVIADGHHRYETALAYRDERAAAEGSRVPVGESGYDYVMAFVVELAEDQLTVEPIHRTITGVPDGVDVADAFARWFEVSPAGPPEERFIASLVDSRSLALVTRDGVWLLDPLPALYEAAGSDLDSALVATAVSSLEGAAIENHHDWRHVLYEVESGEAAAAVLLRPVSVAQISRWAAQKKRMPPKSTYFFPKPRTGMVFRSVEGG